MPIEQWTCPPIHKHKCEHTENCSLCGFVARYLEDFPQDLMERTQKVISSFQLRRQLPMDVNVVFWTFLDTQEALPESCVVVFADIDRENLSTMRTIALARGANVLILK